MHFFVDIFHDMNHPAMGEPALRSSESGPDTDPDSEVDTLSESGSSDASDATEVVEEAAKFHQF